MSPYLKWGCIHPRTLLADLAERGRAGAAAYRRELAWREFYADVVFHRPQSLWTSVDPVIDPGGDTGRDADDRFAAWKEGSTGYPYIDAGMRQLLAEGWMHNRVRMGVASFLVKDLHLPWQPGRAHFLRAPGRRRLRLEQPRLAVGGRLRAAGRAVLPHLQPGRPGREVRPRRRLRPPVRSRAARHRRQGGAPAVGAARDAAADYPEPIVDHAAERAESLRRWEYRPRG